MPRSHHHTTSISLLFSVFWLWLLCDHGLIRTELLLIVAGMIFVYTPTTVRKTSGDLDRVVAWPKIKTWNPTFCTHFGFQRSWWTPYFSSIAVFKKLPAQRFWFLAPISSFDALLRTLFRSSSAICKLLQSLNQAWDFDRGLYLQCDWSIYIMSDLLWSSWSDLSVDLF